MKKDRPGGQDFIAFDDTANLEIPKKRTYTEITTVTKPIPLAANDPTMPPSKEPRSLFWVQTHSNFFNADARRLRFDEEGQEEEFKKFKTTVRRDSVCKFLSICVLISYAAADLQEEKPDQVTRQEVPRCYHQRKHWVRKDYAGSSVSIRRTRFRLQNRMHATSKACCSQHS